MDHRGEYTAWAGRFALSETYDDDLNYQEEYQVIKSFRTHEDMSVLNEELVHALYIYA